MLPTHFFANKFSPNVFKSYPSPLIIKIRHLLYTLENSDLNIQFLCVPGPTGIPGNEMADSFAKFTSSFLIPYITPVPWSDFCLILKECVINYHSMDGKIYYHICNSV